jgi:hypothetical protein
MSQVIQQYSKFEKHLCVTKCLPQGLDPGSKRLVNLALSLSATEVKKKKIQPTAQSTVSIE